MVSLFPLSPTSSAFSAIKTPDSQSPGPSASEVKTEETLENNVALKSAAEGDIQMEYSYH